MTTCKPIEATLHYDASPAFDADALGSALAAMFHDDGLDLALDPTPPAGTLRFAGCAMGIVIEHANSNITVSVMAARQLALDDERYKKDEQARRATCMNAVHVLKARMVPRSIDWSDAEMAAAGAPAKPRRKPDALNAMSAKDRMDLIFGPIADDGPRFEGVHQAVADTHDRLDQSFEAVQTEQAANNADADAPVESGSVRPMRFPELLPAEDELRLERRGIFPCDAIELTHSSAHDETTNPSERAEADDIAARLTVYVLNTILMVVAFPVGFGMLIFNILGGENLRTTAHVMALTGMGTALAAANVNVPFLSLI